MTSAAASPKVQGIGTRMLTRDLHLTMAPQDAIESPAHRRRERARLGRRRRAEDGDSPLLWRLALAAALSVVALAAAGSLLA
jgi:hypothetical protein